MKENSVLQVLMYLFQNHMRDNCDIAAIETDLIECLESAGFVLPTINRAIGWLANLSHDNEEGKITSPKTNSFRVFTDDELHLFGEDCIAFLIELEEQSILTPEVREIVIQQVIELQSEGVDLSLVKWVALMVLFNYPNQEDALSSMELLVLDSTCGGIH